MCVCSPQRCGVAFNIENILSPDGPDSGVPKMSQIAFPIVQKFSEQCLTASKTEQVIAPFDAVLRDRGVLQWYVGSLGFVNEWKGFGFDRIPPAWRQRYLEAGHAAYDPVFQHAARGGRKTTWSDCKAIAAGEETGARALQVFDEAAEFGLKDGLVMPIHGLGDLPAAVAFGGEDLDLGDDAQASLYLMGALAYEGLRRIVEQFKPVAPMLSEQELRVLRWTAEGKSATTIGVILRLSPHTVREYHEKLRAKYAVATLIQVVVFAALDGNLRLAAAF